MSDFKNAGSFTRITKNEKFKVGDKIRCVEAFIKTDNSAPKPDFSQVTTKEQLTPDFFSKLVEYSKSEVEIDKLNINDILTIKEILYHETDPSKDEFLSEEKDYKLDRYNLNWYFWKA